MSGQSKRHSAAEAVLNVVVGYGVAVATQAVIFPLVGIHGVSLETNMEMGVLFTIVSLVRSYTLRRVFNACHTRNA